jgi:hypothetical protein
MPTQTMTLLSFASAQPNLRFAQSYNAEDKSRQRLEIAKTGVAQSIETDEAIATTWINQQPEALNVKPT